MIAVSNDLMNIEQLGEYLEISPETVDALVKC